MTLSEGGFRTFFGRKNEPGPNLSEEDIPEGERGNHWKNFIDCIRTRRWQDLNAEMLEGHMSTSLAHLGIISYSTGRKLTFNPYHEKFINDDDANTYLTRQYRHQYVMPDEV